MLVAGAYLNDNDIVDLDGRLQLEGLEETARRLEDAYQRDARVFALSAGDRDNIFVALDRKCPRGLAELRAILAQQQGWQTSEAFTARND